MCRLAGQQPIVPLNMRRLPPAAATAAVQTVDVNYVLRFTPVSSLMNAVGISSNAVGLNMQATDPLFSSLFNAPMTNYWNLWDNKQAFLPFVDGGMLAHQHHLANSSQ